MGWHRLRLLRQILDELVPGVEQFLLVNNVVAVEDGAALVPGQEHGDPLGFALVGAAADGGEPFDGRLLRPDTAEAGELSPRDPVEGRGHRQVAPVEGKTANPPRLGPFSPCQKVPFLLAISRPDKPWGWRWPSPGFLDQRVRDGA